MLIVRIGILFLLLDFYLLLGIGHYLWPGGDWVQMNFREKRSWLTHIPTGSDVFVKEYFDARPELRSLFSKPPTFEHGPPGHK